MLILHTDTGAYNMDTFGIFCLCRKSKILLARFRQLEAEHSRSYFSCGITILYRDSSMYGICQDKNCLIVSILHTLIGLYGAMLRLQRDLG